ncbi:orotidine-5'-phosphate decarboxylase [Candidatus Saccharibacteria bacterium]|nr:orotidine-5'-phosphate decarboxylase [Candidatus Saccharibacteria bacterium]
MASFKSKLGLSVAKNNSLVCVGLDPVLSKLPASVASQAEPLLFFNRAIIDATADLVCAFKPNCAFYESIGARGIEQLQKTCDYILKNYPNVPVILDGKRADIGTTNEHYARFVFDYLKADAITVHPYFGGEALKPFLSRQDKGIIILCRTSNPGATEFQDLKVGGEELYKVVARNVAERWNSNNNCLLVVAATYPRELASVRAIVGDEMVILVPGVGAQGGDLRKTLEAGLNSKKEGLIISSSREIIFASTGDDFAKVARQKTIELRDKIKGGSE